MNVLMERLEQLKVNSTTILRNEQLPTYLMVSMLNLVMIQKLLV